MMNDMIVPKEIYFMRPAMHPITLEIYYKKSDNVCKNCSLYMKNGNFIHQPAVSNNCNANTKYIFYNISNSAAETGNTVKSANNMKPLFPFYNFFNYKEKEKERNRDV